MTRIIPSAVALTLCVAGCAMTWQLHDNALISRLNNRGPVALSSDNPFIAANLMLAREIDKSPDLKGFVDHRGTPAALEVKHEFLGPLFLYFYYPKEKQYYSLEDIGENTWLIKGPFSSGSDDNQRVAAMTNGQGTEASLVRENPRHSDSGNSASQETPSPVKPQLATNSPSAEAPPRAGGFQSPTLDARIQSDADIVNYFSSLPGQPQAEISPKGDLVHYVTSSGESFILLSRWYTTDSINEDKLRRINKFGYAKEPTIGDTIVVPSYLVKNKLKFPEQAVKMFQLLDQKLDKQIGQTR